MTQEWVRLRMTLVAEYDADPDMYGTNDPAKMAAIDQENWRADPTMLFGSFENDELDRVTVEPVGQP